MTLRVPRIAPRLIPTGGALSNDIRAAYPVRGPGQWQEMAKAANWLAGVGGTLGAIGDGGSISVGSSATIRFYVWPRSQHTTWVWTACLHSHGNGSRGTVTLNPGGTSYNFTLQETRPQSFNWVHVPSSVATGEASIQVSVSSNSPAGVNVVTLGLYELPRNTLPSGGGTAGVIADSCKSAQAIYKNTTTADKYSVQGVYEQIRDARDNCRRQALFNWHSGTGVTTATTTFTNIFRINPAMQTRHLTSGTTTGNVAWNIYALVTGASASGEARITMASGGTSTITVTSTTAAWQTPATFAIETDDFSQSGLVRGGTRDTAAIEIRRVTGTSITIYDVSVGESG